MSWEGGIDSQRLFNVGYIEIQYSGSRDSIQTSFEMTEVVAETRFYSLY